MTVYLFIFDICDLTSTMGMTPHSLEGEALDKERPWEIAKQEDDTVKMFILSSLRACDSFGIFYNDGLRGCRC
jgi:hypothetical protein